MRRRQAQRTTTERGYGTQHQRERAKWKPLVAAGAVQCWRCGLLIDPAEPWDLGHDDDDRSIYRGPEHANRCNRRSAARRGGLIAAARRRGVHSGSYAIRTK